ncbi:MAG: UDP-glucose 4-epimerase GalE, partial [Firmicutes bacterium]|nr:UDP-glucose 4-epimerase GalE [Bacillota bacterium]
MKILLAGGAGYIGSHTAVALINAGYDVVIADNLVNSNREVINRIESITGTRPGFFEGDVKDKEFLRNVFSAGKIDGVIHFAGLKAVGESVQKPLEYYRNNLDSTLSLLEIMREFDVKDIVFSSSATVYGEGNQSPYKETMEKGACSNPYGWTKSMIEQILMDAASANEELSVVLLRYFNPIGAHESGLIGEDPLGIPNNLMPFISQVAVGKRDKLTVFGGDYPTPDGTCLRDYLHVMDLAEGHIKAVEFAKSNKGTEVFNLGTGTPYSVLDIVETFERNSGVHVNHEIGERRDGDLPEVWADVSKAERLLGWKAARNLDDMCRDSWNWQKNNPNGYR